MRWLYGISCALYAAGALLGVSAVALPARRRGRLTLPPKAFVMTGWLLHTAYAIALGVQHGRHPLATPHEILMFLVWASMFVYIAVDAFRPVKAFSAFFVPLVALLAIGAAYLDAGSASPAAKGLWVKLHGMSALLGTGAFARAASAALMYIIQQRQLKGKHTGKLFAALPSLDLLDRLNWISAAGGFVLFTVALFSGAALSQTLKTPEQIRSGWMLLGVCALAWAVFGIVVYCRLTQKFRGRKIAYLTLAGLLPVAAALALILATSDSIHAISAA